MSSLLDRGCPAPASRSRPKSEPGRTRAGAPSGAAIGQDRERRPQPRPVSCACVRAIFPALRLVAGEGSGDVTASLRLASEGPALDPWRLGGEVWGYVVRRPSRVGFCAATLGANLVPVETTPDARLAMAAFELSSRAGIGRRCSSIVGPQSSRYARCLGVCWSTSWGVAREVRADQQPLLVIEGQTFECPRRSTGVRQGAGSTRSTYCIPACVAMFTEEVGVSPVWPVVERTASTDRAGCARSSRIRARVRPDRGRDRVVFKAEIGAVSERACQVQGVWVDARPCAARDSVDPRDGHGRSTQALAAIAPIVSASTSTTSTPRRGRPTRSVGFSSDEHLHDRAVLNRRGPTDRGYNSVEDSSASGRISSADRTSRHAFEGEATGGCCACRPCSFARCARTRPTPRSRATAFWYVPVYVRRARTGHLLSWLPLGYLVYRNVERIVRDRDGRRGLPGGAFPCAAASGTV